MYIYIYIFKHIQAVALQVRDCVFDVKIKEMKNYKEGRSFSSPQSNPNLYPSIGIQYVCWANIGTVSTVGNNIYYIV